MQMLSIVPGKPGLVRLGLYAVFSLLPLWQPGLVPLVTLAAGIVFAVAMWRRLQNTGISLFFFLIGIVAYPALYYAVAALAIPFLHPLSIEAWRWLPVWGMALVAILATAAAIFFGRRRRASQPDARASRFPATALALIWLLAIVAGGVGWFVNNHQKTYDWQVMSSLHPEVLSQLPESDPDRIRILPQATALDFAQNSNQDNRTTTMTPIIAPCPDGSGKQCWQSAFHLKGMDEGIFYNFTGDIVMDVVHQPADSVEMATNTQPRGAFFFLGPNSWPVKAAIAVHNPFSKAERPVYYLKANGDWVYLIPYTSYRPTILGAMVPYLAGVLEVNIWGLIWDHSVSSAIRHFPDVAFFPTTLDRWYAERYADWRGGITGTVTKKDHLEISEAEAEGDHWNPPPYLQYFLGIGQQSVIGLEPRGLDSSSLREILFFDGATGALKVYRVPSKKVLNGPREATGMTRKLDWEAALRSKKVEPLFLVKGGNLFYLIGLVSDEDQGKGTADHPYNESVIIDAESMDKGLRVGHGGDVRDFLKGKDNVLPSLDDAHPEKK
ncbi:MAG TPA: hypothetical protein V6D08_14990 [Candidatus Obscuribacterales bacterium]